MGRLLKILRGGGSSLGGGVQFLEFLLLVKHSVGKKYLQVGLQKKKEDFHNEQKFLGRPNFDKNGAN